MKRTSLKLIVCVLAVIVNGNLVFAMGKRPNKSSDNKQEEEKTSKKTIEKKYPQKYRMKKEKDKIVVYDKNKKIIKEMWIGYKENRSQISKGNEKGNISEIVKESMKGDITENGEYFWMVEKKEILSDSDRSEVSWTTKKQHERQISVFKYFDKNGNLLWKKENIIAGPSVSSDGKKILLVVGKIPYDPNKYVIYFPHNVVLFNDKGEVIWHIGTYELVSGEYITKNGKYGRFYVNTQKSESFSICFDVDNQHLFNSKGRSGIIITEEGKVFKHKNVGKEMRDGMLRTKFEEILIHQFK